MKKSERVLASLQIAASEPLHSGAPELDPCYTGYFRCFNAQQYYQAHDVLEQLWLRQRDANWLFFKALIQIAGAFVHLQKQALRPDHPKDGRRLFPAARLFQRGASLLAEYRPRHLDLDVDAVCAMAERYAAAIIESRHLHNPWRADSAPQIALQVRD